MRRKIWKFAIRAAVVLAIVLVLDVGLLVGTRNLWRKHHLRQEGRSVQSAVNAGDESVKMEFMRLWCEEHGCKYAFLLHHADTGEVIPVESIDESHDVPPLIVTLKFENWYSSGTFYQFSFRPRNGLNAIRILYRKEFPPKRYLAWP